MESYRLEQLSFTYGGRQQPALQQLSLRVEQGEFITLAGASGCGKTTLLRLLKPALAPQGLQSGAIYLAGQKLASLSQREQSSLVGFVAQNPDNQIVTDKVWHELAFGLESLGLPNQEIRLRVAEVASFFGIESWFYRDVAELSGGQKQLLNLAAVMAMQPTVLLLDEPTSQLDPIAATELLSTLAKINRELGTTIIVAEQRLEEILPLSDRIIFLEQGRLLCEGNPREVGLALKERGHGLFLGMPTPMRVWAAVENNLPCPVTVHEGRAWLDTLVPLKELPLQPLEPPTGKPVVALDEIWFKYEKQNPDVLKGLSFTAHAGEITAILGGNGAGKSTLLALTAGLLKPYRGKVRVEGRLAMLPQNPQALFLKKTVAEDLQEIASEQPLSAVEQEAALQEVCRLCHLENLLHSHPYDLSGGEQQRAALAKVLLLRPRVLLLDEPTKGLDAAFKQELAAILRQLAANGVAVVMVSHDVEFCASYVDRCVLLFDGAVVSAGGRRDFFSGHNFYTSSANRMARHLLPQAVTAEDIIAALGGRAEQGTPLPSPKDEQPPAPSTSTPSIPPPSTPTWRQIKQPPNQRAVIAALLLLLTIPLTIYVGWQFFGDRKYVFISLLIIIQAMLPFVLAFEGRKPKARELMLIAVLCGIAVAGRAAFFMLPQFKPVAAVVIIAGVALGCETGFLVGALAAFVSNFFFGQGPWAPWQMFAFGSIGFLAGLLFHRDNATPSRAMLAFFGGISVFFIYGGLMNPAAVLMFQPSPTWQMFVLAYIQGLPFDLMHAAATVIFLLLIAEPMLEKLARMRLKYGIIAAQAQISDLEPEHLYYS